MVRRITVITRYFWPEGGGAEHATYLIIRDVLSRVGDVTVISGTRRPAIVRGVNYVFWAPLSGSKPRVLLESILRFGDIRSVIEDSDIVYIPSNAVLPLTILVRRTNPSARVILHLHDFQAVNYEAAVINGRSASLVEQVRIERFNGDLTRALSIGYLNWLGPLYAAALGYADDIICVSHAQARVIEDRLRGIRCRVIYNPIPEIPEIEKAPTDEPLFVSLGGDRYVKGFHVLLGAIRQLALSNRKLVIVVTRTRDRREFVLGNLRLVMAGRLSYNDVIRVVGSSWSTLFLSVLDEPLPYAVIESLLLKTIPIAIGRGGVPEILKGSGAEEFMVNDEYDIVNVINKVAAMSREELVEIGNKLREYAVKKFDNDEIRQELLRVFLD